MPKIVNDKWPTGAKSTLAEKVGVSPAFITRLIRQDSCCSRETALLLAKASRELGLPISLNDWIFNKISKNPYLGETPPPKSTEN